MKASEVLEGYLLALMTMLCDADAGRGIAVAKSPPVDELGLFDINAPFKRVTDALGAGSVARPRVVEGAPESLRLSVEHRYSLLRWPSFEFAIFESEVGIAWGHAFVRRTGAKVPTIAGIATLSRWSHIESEVRAAFGAPMTQEGWPPWESTIYRYDGCDYVVCYVFGLLQNVVQSSQRFGR